MSILNGGTKSLTEVALRRKLTLALFDALFQGDHSKPFIPDQAIRGVARWIFSLHLTTAEKAVASQMTKGILSEYERRLRLFGQALEYEVYKRQGG